VLATSREVLRIDGDYVYRVPPLDVPPEYQMEPEAILGHDAVELFMARTTTQDPDISLHGENLSAIASICRHLDGIPLAIELPPPAPPCSAFKKWPGACIIALGC
jgi:predicted ATPase